MLEEGNQAGSHGNELLGRHVHVVDVRGRDFDELAAALTGGDTFVEVFAGLVDRVVRLPDEELLFLVGGEVFDLVGHLAVLDLAVRRLDEAELVDPGVGAHRVDETDVRTFRGFDRADAAVVRRMDVADFEAGAVAVQTARPEGGEAALVRQLGQRVGLVHELRKLGPAEEIAHDGREGLRVDQLLRGHALDVHVEQGHALLDQALGTGEAHAALVGEEFTDGPHAAGAEVVDVVDHAFTLLELEQILHGTEEVLGHHDALVGADLAFELAVDLVTADAGQVVLLRVEEEALEQGAGVGGGRRVAGTQLAIDVLEGAVLILGRILAERLEKDFILTAVDHFHRLVAEGDELADDADGERLVGLGHHEFAVLDVLEGHLVAELLLVHLVLQLEALDGIEIGDDVAVGRVAQRAEEGRREELAATAAAVEVDVKQVVGVELHFQPGAAVGNDAERVEDLAVEVRGFLEADARRAVELGDDDALGTVDDECAAAGHHRQFAHVNALLFHARLVLQLEGHVERGGEAFAGAEGVERSDLGVLDVVGNEVEFDRLVIALDREDFTEHRLEPRVGALAGGDVLLHELLVGAALDLDEVWGFDDFLDFPEVETVGHGSR